MPDNRGAVATRSVNSARTDVRPALCLSTESRGGLACVGPQSSLFFSEDAGDVERAKRLCLTCPARDACLAGAIERREPWGVWGGELFHGGSVIPHRRPRGRPRKRRPSETPGRATTGTAPRRPPDGSPCPDRR